MDLMDLVAERVRILYEGIWSKSQVGIEEDVIYSPIPSEAMTRVALARFTERKAKNPRLFDGDAFHLDLASSTVQPNCIILAIGPMRYSLYDIARKEYMEEYGWETLPTGIGVCAVVLTPDLKIVMHHRFSHVDSLGKIAVIGGILQQNNPFNEITEELQEELGLVEKEIEQIRLIGISNWRYLKDNHEQFSSTHFSALVMAGHLLWRPNWSQISKA